MYNSSVSLPSGALIYLDLDCREKRVLDAKRNCHMLQLFRCYFENRNLDETRVCVCVYVCVCVRACVRACVACVRA